MTPSNIGDIIAALVKHSDDVVEIVNRIGLVNMIQSAPALYRILDDVAKRKRSLDDLERILYYSDETRDRVKKFQEKHGLTPDGLVGDNTWRKVEQLLSKS